MSTMIHSKIFYYDYSCMEMMFINSEEAFKSIYCEYYTWEYTIDELKNKLLLQLKYLSLIRKNNETKGWGIKIDGISLHNAFNNETKELDNGIIIKKLNDMNRNPFENDPDKQGFVDAEFGNYNNYEDLLGITQGHDFLTLFSIFCIRSHSRAASETNIASSLRCAYRKTDFRNTVLFSQLVEYENRNVLKIVS